MTATNRYNRDWTNRKPSLHVSRSDLALKRLNLSFVPGFVGKKRKVEVLEESPPRTKKKMKLSKSDAAADEASQSEAEDSTTQSDEGTNDDDSVDEEEEPESGKKESNESKGHEKQSPTEEKSKGSSKKEKSPTSNIQEKHSIMKQVLTEKKDVRNSTVKPVPQKGGILRSVQLSNHPVLRRDQKMDVDPSALDRYVCAYCAFSAENGELVRKHLAEEHKKQDPTVIDKLCFVRKQRCKTFHCWNPSCSFKTAVCEERETHMEATDCKSAYESLFGAPAPRVQEKKSYKKSLKRSDVEVASSNGDLDEERIEELREKVLALFKSKDVASMERADILKALKNCNDSDLTEVLRNMAQDSEIMCTESTVFLT